LRTSRKLNVQMDGALISQMRLVSLNVAPAEITWRADRRAVLWRHQELVRWQPKLVIYFNRDLGADFELGAKPGYMLLLDSPAMLSAPQLLAYVESGLWKRNAARANALRFTNRHGKAAAYLLHPVQGQRSIRQAGLNARKQACGLCAKELIRFALSGR